MARKRRSIPPDTIWEIPDSLWAGIELILDQRYPRKATGRPPVELRTVMNGIVFRMRTSCQWNKLPEKFGSDSTVHRWFQRFCADGIFEQLWAQLVDACDDLAGVQWEWQSADGAMSKARFGGISSGEIPRIAANRARNAA
jgi:putative transposase